MPRTLQKSFWLLKLLFVKEAFDPICMGPPLWNFGISDELYFFQSGDPKTNSGVYTLHLAKGDARAGYTKAGYLNKRSEGRLRNVWQRRKCRARDGFLEIYHADETKPPTRVNLLTCQMKPVMEERLCFDVVSYNRTYHFQVSSSLLDNAPN